MKSIGIGIVGGGYAAWLHGCAYEKVSKVPFRLVTVADVCPESARKTADLFGFQKTTINYEEMLCDDDIDIIDICTPPVLHSQIVAKAMKAGKHVICEKPLTGYFGRPGDAVPIGKTVSKAKMYQSVLADMDEIKEIVMSSKGKFMYAENFVYAPSTKMAAQMIQVKRSKILFMKGEESLKGSSSPLAGQWDKTGGGSLMRVGCHPLTGMLYLKGVEAKARGECITVKSVVADTSVVTKNLSGEEHQYIDIYPDDVEDIATVSITFSDDSKALIIATDVCLGGAKNYMELYCNNANFVCNMTPVNIFGTYFPDEKDMEGMDLGFGLSTKAGWNHPFVSDDLIRGYIGEFQDFLECACHGNREPLSSFELAYESMRVMYAAYLSAEEGRKILL